MIASLIARPGSDRVVLVAPHARAPYEAALPYFSSNVSVRDELAARVLDWHDEGSAEALEAAADVLGSIALKPTIPRAVVDLNRGWAGRVETVETLFGKGAVDTWVRANLVEGGLERLEGYWRGAMAELRAACANATGLVELHSYGDLGSSYDRVGGGRPVRRPTTAIVHGAPWATARPVGIARLIPANLRGTPWRIESAVGNALADVGLEPGPSPYPTLLPWNLSARFLADRWFGWLASSGRLPASTASALVDLCWGHEQDPTVDVACEGGGGFEGAQALAAQLGEWSHEGPALADRFSDETGVFTLGVELRIDRVADAPAMGRAVANALAAGATPAPVSRR
ncbi:MAG: hypothetical protein H0V89_11570 [Deltaproteobacteria bacterium]|nr:hypothetical protein [Deltaproteobacteria bacterium]